MLSSQSSCFIFCSSSLCYIHPTTPTNYITCLEHYWFRISSPPCFLSDPTYMSMSSGMPGASDLRLNPAACDLAWDHRACRWWRTGARSYIYIGVPKGSESTSLSSASSRKDACATGLTATGVGGDVDAAGEVELLAQDWEYVAGTSGPACAGAVAVADPDAETLANSAIIVTESNLSGRRYRWWRGLLVSWPIATKGLPGRRWWRGLLVSWPTKS